MRPSSSHPPSTTPGSATHPDSVRVEARPASKDAYLRFVGDLSPEASFLTNSRPNADAHKTSRHAEVGVWLGQRPDAGEELQTNGNDANIDGRITYDSTTHRAGLTGLQAMSSLLRQECLSVLPPEYDFGILLSLYYSKIDPLFPILKQEVLDSHNPIESVALKQCICLVAAFDPKVRRHLRLPHTERVLSPIEFREYVAAAVKQSLDLGFIHDKVVLLQVCVLMAFYAEKTNCSEVSTYYVSQAVHHSQTLGLHLGWPDDGIRTEKSRRIFWCIWVLDRLNAAANGRPILMHRPDMDMRIFETDIEQPPPFRLLIRISKFLDDVISIYRPQSSMTADEHINKGLTFEELVRETDAVDVGSALLGTLLHILTPTLRAESEKNMRLTQYIYTLQHP